MKIFFCVELWKMIFNYMPTICSSDGYSFQLVQFITKFDVNTFLYQIQWGLKKPWSECNTFEKLHISHDILKLMYSIERFEHNQSIFYCDFASQKVTIKWNQNKVELNININANYNSDRIIVKNILYVDKHIFIEQTKGFLKVFL